MLQLSVTDILTAKNPLSHISEWLINFHSNHGDDAVRRLPINLQRLLAYIDVESEVLNGGWRQYFGNRTNFSHTLDSMVYEVPAMLDALNVHKLSSIMRDATLAWTAHNDAASQSCSESQCGSAAASGPCLDKYDYQFYEVQQEVWAVLNQILHDNPTHFVYNDYDR